MKKVDLTIVVVLIIAFLSAIATAQPEGNKGDRRQSPRPMDQGRMHKGLPDNNFEPGVGMILRLKEKLALTDEQVEQLKALKTDKDQKKAVNQAVKEKRLALKNSVESNASEDTIRSIASELGKAMGDRAVLRAKTKAQIDAILTNEQKATLQKMKEEGRQKMSEKYKSMKGKGRPAKGAGRPSRSQMAFSRIDTDGDGVISPEEFEAHMQQMRGRYDTERPRRPSRSNTNQQP